MYHLPLVPKIRWAVKDVIFKVVPSGKLCSVSFLLACHRKEGINNCLIFVFNTPNIKVILLLVFIQGSSDQTAVEEASATTYPPFGRLSLHRFVNQHNSVLPVYILFWLFGVLCYITRLKEQSSLVTQMMACQNFCLCKLWHFKCKKHCILLNMCVCIGIGMNSHFLYGEKGR